jgi:predicted dehydrogenase
VIDSGERIRVGVLGCGPISQFAHLDACRKARHAELYAICDAAPRLLDRMTAVHSPAVAYSDYDQMLADPQVDAVIVAIADQFHVAACDRALAAGKHVLVEKPMGVTVEECDALRARAQTAGLLLQIGNMKRFDPGIAFAQRFVEEEIGELLALKLWYCDSTYRYTMTDNLQPIPVLSDSALRPAGDPKADRQRYLLLGHGSHLVDTARFLGGEIEAVRARLVKKFDAHCWFVDVDFANGAVGHLDLTIAVRMDFHEGFQIYGEHGSVIGKTYLPWFFRSSDVECFSVRDGTYRRPLGEDAHFYKLQIDAFAEAILRRDGQVPGASGADGAEALRALVAISRSCETGERTRLADVSGGV